MDYIELAKSLMPRQRTYQLGLALAGGVLGLYVLSFPYSWIQYHRTEKYRLSVCWEHFESFKKAEELNSGVTIGEVVRRRNEYTSCLKAARKGQKIYPPAL